MCWLFRSQWSGEDNNDPDFDGTCSSYVWCREGGGYGCDKGHGSNQSCDRVLSAASCILSGYDGAGVDALGWRVISFREKIIRSKTEELLKLCRIYEAKDRAIGSYSGGMKQRLAIAQALINSPKVLILDEPVSALDPMGRKDVLTLIEHLKQEMLIFMSTHILDDIERVADHIIMINSGKIEMSSSMKQIKEDYIQPVIEFQLEQQNTKLVALLKERHWVEECIETENAYQVRVNDQQIALKELPCLITESGGVLLHYQLSKLTLEDIFMKVVNA